MTMVVHRHIQPLLLLQLTHKVHVIPAGRDAAAQSQDLQLARSPNLLEGLHQPEVITHIGNHTQIIHLSNDTRGRWESNTSRMKCHKI